MRTSMEILERSLEGVTPEDLARMDLFLIRVAMKAQRAALRHPAAALREVLMQILGRGDEAIADPATLRLHVEGMAAGAGPGAPDRGPEFREGVMYGLIRSITLIDASIVDVEVLLESLEETGEAVQTQAPTVTYPQEEK